MPEKIIFFANSRYPHGLANSINVFRMATAFAGIGYDVTLVSLRSRACFKKKLWQETCGRLGDNPDIKAKLLWFPILRGAEVFLSLFSLLYLPFVCRKTIIYTRVRYVAFIASALDFKAVYECHSPPQKSWQEKVDRWMLSKNNLVTVMISEGLKGDFVKKNLHPINCFIAPDAGRLIRKSSPQKEEFTGGCINIGYVGSLYSGRGFETLLKLSKKMKGRRFYIIGDVKTLSTSQDDLPDNMVLYDKVSPDQAEKLLPLFDALLMPYQEEVKIRTGQDTSIWMSPMKMFEYMLSGVPIVSSNLKVLREILKDGKNSLLVSPTELTEWEKAIEKLDFSELRYKLSNNAYLEASKKYTWDIRAGSIKKYIDEIFTEESKNSK